MPWLPYGLHDTDLAWEKIRDGYTCARHSTLGHVSAHIPQVLRGSTQSPLLYFDAEIVLDNTNLMRIPFDNYQRLQNLCTAQMLAKQSTFEGTLAIS